MKRFLLAIIFGVLLLNPQISLAAEDCNDPEKWNQSDIYQIAGACPEQDCQKIDPLPPIRSKATCVRAGFTVTPWEQKYITQCQGTDGVDTAIGCVPTGELDLTLEFVLKFALAAAGGVLILMIIVTGYGLLTSQGNPEKLAAAKENIVSIFSGLILIVFSLVLLQTIGADILGLPTF